MSIFTKLPLSIQEINSKDRLNIILTYAIIKSQITDSSLTASISEERLSEITNISRRTIIKYIQTLEPYFLAITQNKSSNKFPYNVYHFADIKKDYSIVKSELLTDTNISSTLKGLLIVMKMNCEYGTDYLRHNSISDLAKKLKVNRHKLAEYIKELLDKGYIKLMGKAILLPRKYFPLYTKQNLHNLAYNAIYSYCLYKDTLPPIKAADDANLGIILAQYPTMKMLLKALFKRCPNLPDNVTLEYFTKALRNIEVEKVKYEPIKF